MIEYTVEELEMLRSMLIEADRHSMQAAIENKLNPYIGKDAYSGAEAITKYLTGNWSNQHNCFKGAYEKMYEPGIRLLPLDHMPLYINDPDICTRVTAVWRLKIGK
jgi:hypothetical protein